MNTTATNILNWIERFNEQVRNFNKFYQVPPIAFRKNSDLNCLRLSEITDEYIQFLIKDFLKGVGEQYSLNERIYLPNITKLIPSIKGIEFADERCRSIYGRLFNKNG